MPVLPPASSPTAALSDLRAFLRQRSREQVWAAIMAVLITAVILILFFVDSKINTAPPPRIVYVQNYAPGRTDAEIVVQQKKDQAAIDAAKAEKKRQFQQLQKQLGIE